MCCRNGLYVFNLWDNYSVTIPLLCVGMSVCLCVCLYVSIYKYYRSVVDSWHDLYVYPGIFCVFTAEIYFLVSHVTCKTWAHYVIKLH